MIEIAGSKFVNSVAFLPDERFLVGGGEGSARYWRVEDGKEVGKRLNTRGSDTVLCLDLSPDGKWIVIGTEAGWVSVWDTNTRSKVREFHAHECYPVETLDMSPDGTRIATGSHDSTVCTWSFSSGKRILGPLRHDSTLAAVKYSPDGRLLATATCTIESIRIYDSQDSCLLIDFSVKVDGCDQSIAWSGDSKYLFALSGGNIKRLDVSTGTTLSEWSIHSNESPGEITLAHNGKFIVAATNSTVSFWDTLTCRQIGPILEYDGVLFSLAISRNYDLAACGVKPVILRSLYEVLPPFYCDDTSREERTSPEGRQLDSKEAILSLLSDIQDVRKQQEHLNALMDVKMKVLQDKISKLPQSERKTKKTPT